MDTKYSIDEEQPKHHSSKNRKAWCKGVEGRHHQTTLAPAKYCTEEIKTLVELCTKCGKHINYFWKPYLLSPRSNREWQIWDEAWTRYREQRKL